MRMEWGMRPSRMWVRSTPERTASTQHSTLGIMPPWMTPSRTSRGTSDRPTFWRRVLSSAGSRSRPRTSVRRMSFSAPRATASLAAAVSALML